MKCNDRAIVPAAVTQKGRIDAEYYTAMASDAQTKNLFLHTDLWSSDDNDGLDVDRAANNLLKRFPHVVVSPIRTNVAYLMGVKTPPDGINHV